MVKYVYTFLILLFLVACKQNKVAEPSTYSGQVQGTYFSIRWFGAISQDSMETAIDKVFGSADQQFSTYLPNSIISRFNQSDSGLVITLDFMQLYRISKRISNLTDGAFDPSLGPIINAYGFGPEGKKATNDTADFHSLKRLVGMEHFRIANNWLIKDTTGLMLDFNAIAQGYTVDMLTGLFNAHGIDSYLIEVGGELKANGLKPNGEPWKIGIEKPVEDKESRELVFTLKVQDKAVATSGNYRKFYIKNGNKITHTISPWTAASVNSSLISASVVSDSCAHADALATAFMVMGTEKSIEFLSRNQNYQAILIYLDENREQAYYISEGLKESLEKVD